MPELRIGFRQTLSDMAIMTMPKTAIYEDDLLSRLKHQVRLAR
ncbi:hypothetical protein ARTHRO9V_200154 [Arthrobacter sp. 9V]|nr:hypothetical protein ARTHRO9V_200154 [Arthrobacter sp. 9V]